VTGTDRLSLEVPPNSSVDQLLESLYGQYPALRAFRNSTLIAVGVDYQTGAYNLSEGDEVSLFPPVQGG
jgi:molybdopterin converting factor small subunit